MRLASVVGLVVVAVAAVHIVQGSLLVRRSLLRPFEDTCFVSQAHEKPLMYPIFSYFGKIKDTFVKFFNAAVQQAKKHKLL